LPLEDEAMNAARRVTLADVIDWEGFRTAARQLVLDGVSPSEVVWHTPDSAAIDMFATSSPSASLTAVIEPTTAFTVRRSFMMMCKRVTLHRDPGRFDLMYRLLWRMHHTPDLALDSLDADMIRANLIERAVRRDIHKMKAFVRFRPVRNAVGEPVHIAWFEPEHYIVAATAPFFIRRFAQMRWAIMTPDLCVQ